jgi:hypothetical protein
MKKYFLIYSLPALSIFMIIVLFSCEEEISIPPASTQADFTYVVTEIVNEDTEEISYEVAFTNHSINAIEYLWDFGDGSTSTEENPIVLYESSGKYTTTLTVSGPNNDLHYNNLEKSVVFIFGKNTLYFEDFSLENPDVEELPEELTIWDLDGDGFTWYWSIRNEIPQARSQSYDSATGDALNPDNWLILPAIDLTEFNENAIIIFRYTVGISASTPVYRQEHHGVFISDGAMVVDEFEMLYEETFTQDTPQWEPLEREIDISAYAGKIVYIAVRHYNVSDMDRIFLGELEVYAIE